MAGSRKNVRGRLRDAALELYAERGYDRTTTAQLAARAGVTERTYFRHFPDKREVVFDGEAALLSSLTDAVADAPSDLPPLEVLRLAFLSLVPYLESDPDLQRLQDRVIRSAPELRERGATKVASLTEGLTVALERRGTPGHVASLVAACGIGVLGRVRQDWLAGSPHGHAALLAAAFDDLRGLIAGTVPPGTSRRASRPGPGAP